MATMTFADPAMAVEPAPGSPPDLTNSKSSKSSSFHSESLSDMMGPHDLSHFEDINLDDGQGAQGPSSFPMPLAPTDRVLYEVPPTSSMSMGGSSRATPLAHAPVHSFRDLTASAKPRFPSLKGQVNGAVRSQHQQQVQQQTSLTAPTRSQMRRGFTSPSAPSLATPNIPGRRSRSPSPSNPQVYTSAPRSLSRRSSRNNLDTPAVPYNPRRQSWQHGNRKSVKEREAECEDEGDDELPEDAVIWNVPMSPRPPQDRSPTPSVSNSPPHGRASPNLSRSTSQNSRNSARSSRSPLSGATGLGIRKASAPPSPSYSTHSDAQSVSQGSGSLSRQRTNTWEETYTTLDPDAKLLTEALEEYQAEYEARQELERQKSGSKSPNNTDTPDGVGIVKKKTQSLPPLRRSDPLVDPLQPSKEKEKYLSRTRPSWLPPKDPREEKKHLRELQEIERRRVAAGMLPLPISIPSSLFPSHHTKLEIHVLIGKFGRTRRSRQSRSQTRSKRKSRNH